MSLDAATPPTLSAPSELPVIVPLAGLRSYEEVDFSLARIYRRPSSSTSPDGHPDLGAAPNSTVQPCLTSLGHATSPSPGIDKTIELSRCGDRRSQSSHAYYYTFSNGLSLHSNARHPPSGAPQIVGPTFKDVSLFEGKNRDKFKSLIALALWYFELAYRYPMEQTLAGQPEVKGLVKNRVTRWKLPMRLFLPGVGCLSEQIRGLCIWYLSPPTNTQHFSRNALSDGMRRFATATCASLVSAERSLGLGLTTSVNCVGWILREVKNCLLVVALDQSGEQLGNALISHWNSLLHALSCIWSLHSLPGASLRRLK